MLKWSGSAGRAIEIEVETRSLEEVRELLACIEGDAGGAVTRVMLDNMTPPDASKPGAPQDAGTCNVLALPVLSHPHPSLTIACTVCCVC